MSIYLKDNIDERQTRTGGRRFEDICLVVALLFAFFLAASGAWGQVNVLTAHNDIGRTGQNLQETQLTPANVNALQFGKLFSQGLVGGGGARISGQPLYVSQLTMSDGTVHNVVYVGASTDAVYAFDADTNGGANAKPLWTVSLLTNTTATGTYSTNDGVFNTPTIDLASKTLYLVSSEIQVSTSSPIFRLHALDLTRGAEKFGGPVLIQGSVPGTGSGSIGGTLSFNPAYELPRPSTLLLNGVLYAAFGSINDNGAWHGWIFSYNATNLQQIDVFCTTPNGSGGGVWMGGAGLAAEVNDPTKPYGRMFLSTGNGTYTINGPTVAGQPYSNPSNNYGMSVLDLDLTGGAMTVEDLFSPYNEAALNGQDGDLGSGGPVLLPTQTLASGKKLNPLVQIGKSGMLYILDRDNAADGSNNANTEYSPAGLGGFNAAGNQVVQQVQSPVPGTSTWGAGLWGDEAYWNGNIYYGGINLNGGTAGTSLAAYSFVNGVLSTAATSQSTYTYTYPNPTPSISANGATNGIVWTINYNANGALAAYDATNLANQLYSSNDNPSRDATNVSPVEYVVPTIANGKVYVGMSGQLVVFGLLAGSTAPTPVISPGSQVVTGNVTVTISDSLAGSTIYYTTDGTPPTSSSQVYTAPFSAAANSTVTAIASANGYIQSAPASATYSSTVVPLAPVFSLASGTYIGTQAVTITSSAGAVIYYTIDGPAPTTASAVYAGPLSIFSSETIQAIAVGPTGIISSVVSATYAIDAINFPSGFTLANGPIQFNGTTDLDDFRLQLTNGGTNEAGSAFYATPVNIQSFTTDFTFQLSNPAADGMTFTIQNVGPGAVGASGGGLGYHGIGKSVAVKFDLFNDAGEGPNSTGLFIDGAPPYVPAIDLTPSGVNLHSGNYTNVHITYDGTTLTLTLTDTVTLATWTGAFPVNIPATVGGSTAYVGFTAGTGGQTASQKLTSWTFASGAPAPSYSAGFSAIGLTLNKGAVLNGTRLRLTDGNLNEQRSAFYTAPVNIQQFTTSFNFQLTNPAADGFTFTIQGNGPTSVGGALGYGGMPNSVGIKFDLFNNAGEGPDSTGMYIDGASPTMPAYSLYPTGIDLHSGDVFNAQLTYNGTTLTVAITDTVTGATTSNAYMVDIPATVGGNTAYVGFTGSTGGLAAIQEILSWTYSPQAVTGPAFFGGFSAQSPLTLNNGAALNGTRLRLTDGKTLEQRSAFYTTPVNIQQFTTSFDFQLTSPAADGFTFTIQGNGPTAVGGALGYGGMPNSIGIKFDLFNNAGEGPDSTGMYLNGASPTVPAIDLTPSGVNLHSGDIFNALLAYNGSTLTVTITDTATNASATQTYTVNIPATVGGNTAYVGFTGSTGGFAAIQDILNWSYTSQPVTGPAFFSGFSTSQSQLTLNNGAVLNGTRLRLTDGKTLEQRSAFYTVPVNVQQFTTSFNFQLTNPAADGMTFTIQGDSPTIIGGALGYGNMPKSVGIKFDLYNNSGEGPDSTGMYLNGASPTVPAIDLTPSGVNLHSGDIFKALLTYNGTTLTVTITDTVTGASATQTYTVNIPTTVGSNTAYVGFTASTGGLAATQEILSWSYSSVLVN